MDKRPEQKQSHPLPSLMAGEIIPAPHPTQSAHAHWRFSEFAE